MKVPLRYTPAPKEGRLRRAHALLIPQDRKGNIDMLDFDRIGLLLHIEELVRNHPKLLALKSAVLDELEGHNKTATEAQAEKAKAKAAEEAEVAHRAAVEAKSAEPVARPAPIYPADSGVIQSPSILNEPSAVDRRI